jgi:hypothetical protein
MKYKGDRYSEDSLVKIQYPSSMAMSDDVSELEAHNKTILIGRSEEDAGSKTHAHTYSNIIIDTTPDENTSKCRLKINLKDTAPDDSEALVIKLRKMKVCDENGKTAWVYVLASEYFNEESGFDNS